LGVVERERVHVQSLIRFVKKPLLFTVVVTAAVGGAALAQTPAKVTYNDHVLPIFRNSCLNCHNPDKKKAGLDLSTYQGALTGSESGKVLQSGNPSGSLLFKCVKQIEDPKMPPKGDKLTEAELAIIEKWIAGQLLETANGKVVAAANNNVQVAVVSLERPAGPPPMPGDLPLEPYVRTRHQNALIALGASPWAPLVAVGGQKQIILYNTETLQAAGILPFPEGFPAIIRFSRNGKLLLTGGGLGGKSGKVVLWDIATGERVATIGNEFDQVLAADLSADQQFVALGGPTKLVKIFATKDGKLVHSIKKHTDWVTAIAYSPDGKYLASADRNGGIEIWEGNSGKEYNALAGHKVMVTSLAFMTGVVASASEDGTIKLWDVKEGKESKSWNAHPGGVAWVDFAPDGRLVSCGRDKVAKVWDQTGKELAKVAEPFNDIALRAALSNDRIVAGDWTGEIRVCSLDGKRVGELTANPPSIAERIETASKHVADKETAVAALRARVTAAEAKLNAEKAETEARRKAEAVAEEARRAKVASDQSAAEKSVADLEKRVTAEKSELEARRKTRDESAEAERPAAQEKVDTQKKIIAASESEFDAARKKLAEFVAANAKAEKSTPAPNGELKKKLEEENAALAKLREARGSKASGSPEFAEADKLVQAKKAEIAKLQDALTAAEKTANSPTPAKAKPSAAEEEYVKAQKELEGAIAEVTTAKNELAHWQRGAEFMNVYRTKASLAEKQARYDELVADVKEALAPAEQAAAKLAAAEKAVADSPAVLRERETLLAQLMQTAEGLNKTVGPAQTAFTQKEAEEKAIAEQAGKASASLAEARKQLDKQKEEVTKLREVRAAKPAGASEYAEADAKVQLKKKEIAETEKGIAGAQTKVNELQPQMETAKAEVSRLREALEKARSEAKSASEKAVAAEKALAEARKATEMAKAELDKLRKEVPEITRAANEAKAKAETELSSATKELENAKSEMKRVQSEFEAKWPAPAAPARTVAAAAGG
jgi:mono/diheme cytochrome c family protein